MIIGAVYSHSYTITLLNQLVEMMETEQRLLSFVLVTCINQDLAVIRFLDRLSKMS